MSDETAVLDPIEFIPERTQLELDWLGIAVREADWGDAEHEAFMIKQAIGEIPADRHAPNRKAAFKLRAKTDPTKITLAEAAYKLQQKVGTLQEKGGWILRSPNSSQGFAHPVGAKVYSAVLGGLYGWFMSHREVAPEITLVLTISPYFYKNVEGESVVIKEEAKRALQFIDEDGRGTARGLRRHRIKNLNAALPLRAVILAEECEDAPEDLTETTSQLEYQATALTPLGGATVFGSVVRKINLGPGFLPVLGSEVVGQGHMTHRGPRRFHIHADSNEALEVKFRWRPLGVTNWNEDNKIVTINDANIYDLGEARPQPAVLGQEKWEWQILAKAKSGNSGTIEIGEVWPLPTEQFVVVSEPIPPVQSTLSSLKAPTETSSPGFGAAWANTNNALTDNGVNAVCTILAEETESQMIVVNKFGFALPVGAIVSAVGVTFQRYAEGGGGISDKVLQLYNGGLIGQNYWAKVAAPKWAQGIGNIETVSYVFNSEQLEGLTYETVNSNGFGISLRVKQRGESFGFGASANVDYFTMTVYYSEATEDEGAVCHAQRSMEIRSDGVYRQDETENVWAPLVPDGSFPYSPPPGMEGKPSRGIIIPSVSDLIVPENPTTVNKIQSTRFTRDAYHFLSEAA